MSYPRKAASKDEAILAAQEALAPSAYHTAYISKGIGYGVAYLIVVCTFKISYGGAAAARGAHSSAKGGKLSYVVLYVNGD